MRDELECDYEWHTAICFGHCPLQYRTGWEVYCNKCEKWGFQEAVEVDDCEWDPIGDPWIFDPKCPDESWAD